MRVFVVVVLLVLCIAVMVLTYLAIQPLLRVALQDMCEKDWTASAGTNILVPEPFAPLPGAWDRFATLTKQESTRSISRLRVSQVRFSKQCRGGVLWETRVIGLIENTGPTYLQFGKLRVEFKDARGNPLLAKEPPYAPFVLKPGMSVPFDVDVYHDTAANGATGAGWATLEFRAFANPLIADEAEDLSRTLPSALLVLKAVTLQAGADYAQVSGLLVNPNVKYSGDADIYVSLFDAKGNLVGVGWASPYADVGEEKHFVVELVRGAGLAGIPDHYIIQILP